LCKQGDTRVIGLHRWGGAIGSEVPKHKEMVEKPEELEVSGRDCG